MNYIYLLVAGISTGVVSGLFGIGGGVVLIPILVFLFHFNQKTANGMSLVALLLPVGFFGVLEYFRAGRITVEHVRFGLVIAVGLLLGTYFGARLATRVADLWLRKGFSVLLFILAIRLWLVPA